MTDSMQATWHPSSGAAGELLAGVWHVRAGDDGTLSARVLPDTSTCVVFLQRERALRTDDNGREPWACAAVSGPRSGPMDFELEPRAGMYIVQVKAPGAMQLLGQPMEQLANRAESLDDVLDGAARTESASLADRLHDEPSAREGVRAIEEWATAQASTYERRRDRHLRLLREVATNAASMGVEALADHVAMSRRQLGRVMTERLGFSPKQFARIARFDAAVQRVRFRPSEQLAGVAYHAGYADQAHMNREFRAIGGISPGDLRRPGAERLW